SCASFCRASANFLRHVASSLLAEGLDWLAPAVLSDEPDGLLDASLAVLPTTDTAPGVAGILSLVKTADAFGAFFCASRFLRAASTSGSGFAARWVSEVCVFDGADACD